MVGSNDIRRSKRFYDRLFGRSGEIDEKGRLFYVRRGALFLVSKPIDGKAACHANGGTVGFTFDSPDEVEVWHSAGVEAGGTPIEDPPGWRESRFGRLYLAYLRDPDGNKLCALYRSSGGGSASSELRPG
jgi:catechol 2,3-dioxygenase-like lactoylglutathione lyase family enzyme